MAEQASAPSHAQNGASRTPPYVAFQTFLTMLEDLHTNGLPQKIDRSVLKRFSGGVGSQLLLAVRSLGLVDDKDQPTDAMRALVDSFGTPAKLKSTLRPVIEKAYPFLNSLDLKTTTPSMFADAFRAGTSAKEDVLRKCRTFFLHAAKYVGIEIGPRLTSGSAQRAPSNGRTRTRGARPSRRRSSDTSEQPAGSDAHVVRRSRHSSDYQDKLLDKFPKFDPAWPDDIKKQWFEGFKSFQQALADAEKK